VKKENPKPKRFYFKEKYRNFIEIGVKSRDRKMRRFCQQKYLANLLAMLILGIAIADISIPVIERYNQEVRVEQARLHFEAGAPETRMSMFSPTDCLPRSNIITIVLLMLFFSLFFTKRIILSFLFIAIFIFQIALFPNVVFKFIWSLLQTYFDFNYSHMIYFESILVAMMAPISFWLALLVVKLIKPKTIKNPLI
jgi:hypothetical protein